MKARHPKVQAFVIEHLVSAEAFLDCSIFTGFSFGAAKMKILQTVIKFVGEWISRAGRMPNEENILIIKKWPSIDSETHLRQFLGTLQYVKIVYGPLFAKLTKPLNGLLKKDG